MSTDPGSNPADSTIINLGAFVKSFIAPLLGWGASVFLVVASGQPGVICCTPLAWLLACVSGGLYIRFSDGHPGRWPMLGPALAGATLGFLMALLFYFVSRQFMPVGSDPVEIGKMRTLTYVMSIGGIIACTAFSVFTAYLTSKQLARKHILAVPAKGGEPG